MDCNQDQKSNLYSEFIFPWRGGDFPNSSLDNPRGVAGS